MSKISRRNVIAATASGAAVAAVAMAAPIAAALTSEPRAADPFKEMLAELISIETEYDRLNQLVCDLEEEAARVRKEEIGRCPSFMLHGHRIYDAEKLENMKKFVNAVYRVDDGEAVLVPDPKAVEKIDAVKAKILAWDAKKAAIDKRVGYDAAQDEWLATFEPYDEIMARIIATPATTALGAYAKLRAMWGDYRVDPGELSDEADRAEAKAILGAMRALEACLGVPEYRAPGPFPSWLVA